MTSSVTIEDSVNSDIHSWTDLCVVEEYIDILHVLPRPYNKKREKKKKKKKKKKRVEEEEEEAIQGW